MKMVPVHKSTQDFELFGGLNPGTVRVSTENSKAKVILGRCAVFRPATAVFRITAKSHERFGKLLKCYAFA